MRRALRLLPIVTLLAVSGRATPAAPPAAPVLPPRQVDALVRAYMQQTGTPGVAVAVVDRRGVQYARGYGRDADGAAITPDTPMRIASLSKAFTALAALQLVHEGRLQLDDPVQAHLPTFRVRDPRGAAVTVRHLLNHTSGLSDARVDQHLGSGAVTTARALRGVRQATLTAVPGTRFEYANINYDLAGLLVERLGDAPLPAFLQRRVFRPLGMQAVLTPDCAATPGHLTGGHTLFLKRALSIREPSGYCLGSGGVIASAADLARWLGFQLTGTPALVPGSLLAETRRVPLLPSTPTQRYGMGWAEMSEPGLPVRLGHGGNLISYASHLEFEPGRGLGVVVLTNDNGPAVLLSRNLLRLAAGQPAGSMTSPTVTVDLVLLGLGGVGLFLGGRGVRGARDWARRAPTRPPWRTVMGLLGPGVLPVAVLWAPALMAARPGAWPALLKLLPSSAALWLVAVAALAVLIARLSSLRAPPSRRPRPPETQV